MGNVFCTLGVREGVRHVQVDVERGLTIASAFPLCRAVGEHLKSGARSVTINLERVEAVDPVGLAALLQSARLGERLGIRLSIIPSPATYGALVTAKLVSDLPLVPSENPAPLLPPRVPVTDALGSYVLFAAKSQRLGLRVPMWEDLRLFGQWAQESLLDQMVASDLLYVCRSLGAYHPDFTPLVLNDPTALTLLVQPLGGPGAPVGYVRLFNVRVLEEFAFLETAIADLHTLRKGWGIEASRLLLAFAMDALDIYRVEAKVYAYNLLSVNALKRNGFQQEGILRQARTYEGQRWDILVYSMLREEMAEQRRREGFPYMGLWSEHRDDLP